MLATQLSGRDALASLLLLACASCATTPTDEAPATDRPSRPNILIVLVDDLGWADIGCYGNQAVDTPRIDAFSTQGMRFTDAYAAAPVCSPTRASIMTGKAPARLRLTNHMPDRPSFAPKDPVLKSAECVDRLPLEEVTLAELLKDSGYRTAFLGKWHLAPQRVEDAANWFPDQQGFDLNLGGNGWGGPGRSFFAPYEFPNLKSKTDDEYLPYRIGEEAVGWLRDHAASGNDDPFFMALWHYTVHWPMDAPAELVEKYEARGKQRGLEDPRYAAMTEALDQIFGQVLDTLDETGLADNTIVVFTSDNGALDSVSDLHPLRESKGFLYEGGIRVPMIVRWPDRVAAGTEQDAPVITTDLFATALDAAGLVTPDGHPEDGETLVPLLTGSGVLRRDALFFHYPNYAFHGDNRLGSAIRVGDHKLIEYFDDGSVELYDLRHDLSEKRDLSAEQTDRAAAMRARLKAWREEVDAAMPERVQAR